MKRSGQQLMRIAAAASAALLVATAVAQYVQNGRALDANLGVDSGGYNSRSGRSNYMQRDVYRLNRSTGTFEYDERSAFAQPTYSPRMRATGPNDPLQSAYRRPVTQPWSDQDPFYLDRRTGTFRYDQTNAFTYRPYRLGESPQASVYQQPINRSGAVYTPPRPRASGSVPASNRRASLQVAPTTTRRPPTPASAPSISPQKYSPLRGGAPGYLQGR
ncbi:MAG: hypothetical protein VYC34_02530 [Planctomycetota bacterium]|nr:hypothetical protein [Planctomycetota bacterium]